MNSRIFLDFLHLMLVLVVGEAEEDVAELDEGVEEGVGEGVTTGFASTFSWEIVARIVGDEKVKLCAAK